jgi:putative intracellular protease/amidase
LGEWPADEGRPREDAGYPLITWSNMPDKAVYLLVFDGYADWEPAHAVAELRRHGQYRVETVGLSRDPVVSMGGIRVLPSRSVSELDQTDVAVFILPGGDRWEQAPMEREIEALLKRLDGQHVPIAAICGATVGISKIGLLQGRRHTSNGLRYLQSHVRDYNESANYVDAPAVRDRGLITASGLGDVEFAREIFEELGVLSEPDRALWAQIFRTARLPQGSA